MPARCESQFGGILVGLCAAVDAILVNQLSVEVQLHAIVAAQSNVQHALAGDEYLSCGVDHIGPVAGRIYLTVRKFRPVHPAFAVKART